MDFRIVSQIYKGSGMIGPEFILKKKIEHPLGILNG